MTLARMLIALHLRVRTCQGAQHLQHSIRTLLASTRTGQLLVVVVPPWLLHELSVVVVLYGTHVWLDPPRSAGFQLHPQIYPLLISLSLSSICVFVLVKSAVLLVRSLSLLVIIPLSFPFSLQKTTRFHGQPISSPGELQNPLP